MQMGYEQWMAYPLLQSAVRSELSTLTPQEIHDRFYQNLSFGTGGLRGLMGAGTNRMNHYTVAKATRGLCAYLHTQSTSPSCAIAYDSRNESEAFAKTAAAVLAEHGIAVHFFPTLMPTPLLSFAVRHCKCTAGIVITASHNPAAYNGYKVYGADGCQITLAAAAAIQQEIEAAPLFGKTGNFDALVGEGKIRYLPKSCVSAYFTACELRPLQQPLRVVYSPLNGAGNLPVRRALAALGQVEVLVVPEQELPDGNFPTCPYPNPETPDAMELAAAMCRECGADLFFATDPDCDRLGAGVIENGAVRLFTGNELGVLLFDYVCKQRKLRGTLPARPVAVKTIVTTDMARSIAAKYGVELRNVLTGFKFIGEQIGLLEMQNELDRFVFGFEESYGYLFHTHVRDKDAVSAAALLCEMAAAYKAEGKTLADAYRALQKEHGYYPSALLSYSFTGESGTQTMRCILHTLRTQPQRTGMEIKKAVDFLHDETGLPKSDVLQFFLPQGSVIVRPSGTEPKLKLYVSAQGATQAPAQNALEQLRAQVERFVKETSDSADSYHPVCPE